MLPDFLTAKAMLDDALMRHMRSAEARAMGFFGQIPRQRVFEGNRFSYETSEGKVVTEEFVEFSESIVLTPEETRTADMDLLRAKVDKAISSMASQRKKEVFELLDKVTAETGNVVDAKGALAAEHIFRFFEITDMEFDSRGEPIRDGLTLLINPASKDKVVAALKQFDEDPAWKAKYEILVEKKREEWRAREARRKLV